MYKRAQIIIPILLLLMQSISSATIDSCWSVTTLNEPAPGYFKFGWNGNFGFSLMDNYGVNHYQNDNDYYSLSMNQRLMKNGLWLCYGTYSCKFYISDKNMNVIDSIPPYPSESYCLDLHDIELLSNGHYMLLYMTNEVMDLSKIVDGGSDRANIINTVLVETDRTGTVYWEWNALDHISVTDATPDVDLTENSIDFAHVNSVTEDLDGNILLSFRNLDEITKVNKATGAVMWRFGGSYCKNNQFTFLNDDVNGFKGFSHQHSVAVLSNGNLLLFDNGTLKSPQYSRAVEYQLDEEAKTAYKVWERRRTPDLYTSTMGNAERLPNGNTIINWVKTLVEEVKPNNEVAFEYSYKCDNITESVIYRVYKYVTRMNAVTLPVNYNGTYTFSDAEFNTDASIAVSSKTGNGTLSLEKHDYEPPVAKYGDSCFTYIFPYRWVLSRKGLTSLKGTIKFKVSGISGLDYPQKARIYKRDKEATGSFVPLTTSYNAATGEISADFNGFGEFTVSYNVLGTLYTESPSNGTADIPINGTLQWKTLRGATRYQLQLSTKPDFSDPVLNKFIDSVNTLPYQSLRYKTKYYWRMKAMNQFDTTDWSVACSFTTRDIPAPQVLFPANGLTGFKSGDSLKWNTVEGADHYRVIISAKNDMSSFIFDSNNIETNILIPYKLSYNYTYYWQVRAYQGTTEGVLSAVRCFTTTLAPPLLSYPANDTTDMPLNGSLYWKAVTGSNSYRYDISLYDDFRILITSNNNVTGTSIGYSNLLPDKKYFWRVRANRFYDTSAWSATYSFTTLAAKPVLKSPADGGIKIATDTKLSWDSIATALTYNLQIATDYEFTSIILDTVSITNASFKTKSLPEKRKLYWRVQAVYRERTSPWSIVWSFATDEDLPVAAPVLLIPENNSLCDVDGQFSWEPVAKAEGYILQLDDNKDFTNSDITTEGIASSSHSYESLGYEKTYYWRVKAYRSKDTSNWSETHTFTTLPSHITLAAPLNDDVQIPVSGTFVWNRYFPAQSYQVQLSNESLFGSTIIDSTGITDTILDYKALQYNTTYYWRVRYYKNGHPGDWSSVHSFMTESEYGLETPVLISPEDSANCVLIDGSLQWNPVSGAESYRVGISQSPVFDEFVVRQTGVTTTNYSYPVLDYNSLYYWRITAISSNATSHWSQTRSFLTELRSPQLSVPQDKAVNLAASGILKWRLSDDAGTYHLQIATDITFKKTIVDQTQMEDTIYEYTLSPETSYYWRVKAENSSNCSRWSEAFTFSTEPSSGTEDSTAETISVYPNPASDVVFITYPVKEGRRYTIYTPEGMIVAEGVLSDEGINTHSLTVGCYFIRIDGRVLKFIKYD